VTPTSEPTKIKVTIVRTATFQTPGLEIEFALARINAAKFIFQAAANGKSEYTSQLNGAEAPSHFFDECVAFLANRLQVKLQLVPNAPPPPDKPKLEILKGIPEDLK
jgi:hypothetical protein